MWSTNRVISVPLYLRTLVRYNCMLLILAYTYYKYIFIKW